MMSYNGSLPLFVGSFRLGVTKAGGLGTLNVVGTAVNFNLLLFDSLEFENIQSSK